MANSVKQPKLSPFQTRLVEVLQTRGRLTIPELTAALSTGEYLVEQSLYALRAKGVVVFEWETRWGSGNLWWRLV